MSLPDERKNELEGPASTATGSCPGAQGGHPEAQGQAPVLTVAVVVFNGAASLEDTIQSVQQVAALSPVRLQLVIIDGGSRDGTLDIIQRHQSRLHYWISEPDKGIYDAMNKAWAAASPGSSVLFLGSGDKLLSLPGDFDNEHIFYGDVFIGERLFASHLRRRLMFGNTVHHQALAIPRSLHPEPPFDTRFKVYADFDFNQRLFGRGHAFLYRSELVAYALPGGVSSALDIDQLAAVIRKNHGWPLAAFTALYLKARRLLARLRPGTAGEVA